MMVKDEADIIGFQIGHLLHHVDSIIVADNMSEDGTRRILDAWQVDNPDRLTIVDDLEVAYRQSEKMTRLAQRALDAGHGWVVPVDADELWYADGRRIADFLDGLSPEVQIVRAELIYHVPAGTDRPASCQECGNTGRVERAKPVTWPATVEPTSATVQVQCPECLGGVEPNAFKRIAWRKRQPDQLGKVACRTRPDLVIHQGNHGASTRGTAAESSGLHIRHFAWRSAEQYARKIRNGALAYAAGTFPEGMGNHWRMFGDPAAPDFDDRVQAWFWQHFHSMKPESDSSMQYDPAPYGSNGLWLT